MSKVVFFSILPLLVIVALCATAANAGPGYPSLSLQIGSGNQPYMEAGIYPNPNVPFEALPGQTAGYWYDEGTTNRWAVEYFTQPWPALGDFQWTGHIETGSSDLRATHTFEWFRNNGATTDPRYDWWLIVYSVDTRHQVAYLEIDPNDFEHGSFTTQLSRGGYDIIAAATAVPEPGSMLALMTGIASLVGFARRQR